MPNMITRNGVLVDVAPNVKALLPLAHIMPEPSRLRSRRTASVEAIAEPAPPFCAYRGEELGTLHCGCKGTPRVFTCVNAAVPSGVCLLKPKPLGEKQIQRPDGSRSSFDGVPGFCSICPHADRPAGPSRLTPADLEWISTSQLAEDALKLLQHIEPETVGIIGVPRSGMIPAAILAAHCHLPLYELTNRGPRALASGSRGHHWPKPNERARFFLVDDSSHNGGAMRRARSILQKYDVTYAAVYAKLPHTVDVYARLLPEIHVFDWNILNNGMVHGMAIDPRLRGEGFMLDFDGILCPDPPFLDANVSEEHIENWLAGVKPLRWIPRFARIPWIVSFRRERHRPIIEAWLKKWNIHVNRLILHPAQTAAERDANFDVIAHKAERFKQSDCALFFESEPRQAAIIARHADKPVCCPTNQRFYFGASA